MANKDLFKQAIAEAKSIREAAIANAKEALEETLTPHLKDMLAAKLQEMEDSTVEEEVVNEVEEVEEQVEESVEESTDEVNEDESIEEVEVEEEIEEAPVEEAPGDDEADADAEVDSEESEDEAEDGEEDIEVKDMEVDDLKDLIRDIIAQEHEKMGLGDDEGHSDMDAGDMEPEMGDMPPAEDEEIDLDELLAELDKMSEETNEGKHEEEENMEEGEHKKKKEMEEEVIDENKEESIKEDNSELNQALETIETLQAQLSEVNLLNAKLMYVNKVFKTNNLSEAQKVNVIAAFDKAETVKEVKLVFETVSDNVVTKTTKAPIKESKLGSASKATGNTAAKPEVINEVSDVVRRMQKLAGIN